ncbi:MAG: UDP-N-acetyl glucosamine 2-epimerase [Proteobacteria bacterium]|nr:UDP-N-acetyl glucosamine 2-epimerase [Pseudomonadota bacterium]
MKKAVPKIDFIAGARPNFMKLAPVVRAVDNSDRIDYRIVHTGQHYDANMNDVFFREPGIPDPDLRLEVGAGTHGAQTARIIERYEEYLGDIGTEAIVGFGDVNSTLACAFSCGKDRDTCCACRGRAQILRPVDTRED